MSRVGIISGGASLERLENLIEQRLKPGVDKELIDQRIWDLFGEKWAVMFTDLSGFSRNVAQYGIVHFLQTIHESHRLLIPVLDDHDGILLKTEGDSLMIIFRNVLKAVQASIRMQQVLQEYNLNKEDVEKVLLCIGLGYGDILKIGDHDVFGAQVNAASKLGEDTANAREILVTDTVKDALEDLPEFDTSSFEKIDEIPPGASSAYRLLYN